MKCIILIRQLFIIPIIATLQIIPLFSQEQHYILLGEGNDKTVKLIWLQDQWPEDLIGFDIKRREGKGSLGGPWEKLNRSLIFPEITVGKDFSNVEPSTAEAARLQQKLNTEIREEHIVELNRQDFLDLLIREKEAVKAYILPFRVDYELALISGFGFVDRDIPRASGYEYGLFPVFSGNPASEPVATYYWEYGSAPEPDIPVEFSCKPIHAGKELQINWNFSYGEFVNKHLKGFNIYKNEPGSTFKALVADPLWPSSKEENSVMIYIDEDFDRQQKVVYAIAPVTLFNTEGKKVELTYDPDMFPDNIKAPEATMEGEIASPGDPVVIFWTFDSRNERFIRGFVVERKEKVDEDFAIVSDLILSADRSYEDHSPKKPGTYYFYRVTALNDLEMNLSGKSLLVYYNPLLAPPMPTGLEGHWEKDNGRHFVVLRWDEKPENDTITEGYKLYANFPPSSSLRWEASIPLITEDTFRYEVHSPKSATYRFCVSAMSTNRMESPLSDTIEVYTPAKYIPAVKISSVIADSNFILIKWEYEDIPDLDGFRLFYNSNLILDEATLTSGMREYKMTFLKRGIDYKFSITAVTEFGIESNRSLERTVYVPKRK